MQVIINKINNQSQLIKVNHNDLISSSISQDNIELIFNGCVLQSNQTWQESGVTDMSTVEEFVSIIGGKKKKKKVHNGPKKIAHKHKNEKLRVLKYYSVGEDGKVERLRKNCEICGPGVFMATHHNRYYCGKCFSTLFFNDQQ